jgi:hypothetical protein
MNPGGEYKMQPDGGYMDHESMLLVQRARQACADGDLASRGITPPSRGGSSGGSSGGSRGGSSGGSRGGTPSTTAASSPSMPTKHCTTKHCQGRQTQITSTPSRQLYPLHSSSSAPSSSSSALHWHLSSPSSKSNPNADGTRVKSRVQLHAHHPTPSSSSSSSSPCLRPSSSPKPLWSPAAPRLSGVAREGGTSAHDWHTTLRGGGGVFHGHGPASGMVHL